MTQLADPDRRDPEVPAGRGPGRAGARLPLLRALPPGPAARLRRAVPVASPRSGRAPRGLQDGRHHRDRRAPARRARGHERDEGGPGAGVRARDRRARGRGHEDRQARLLLPRGAAGRELPQDGGGHGPRPAGPDDQARRPSPQHADARLPAAGQGEEDRHGDARDLRAARASPGHGQGQGRARGPRAAHAQPGGLPGR